MNVLLWILAGLWLLGQQKQSVPVRRSMSWDSSVVGPALSPLPPLTDSWDSSVVGPAVPPLPGGSSWA